MGRFPSFIKPQLASLVEELPKGRSWIYEEKFDGYRLLASGVKGTITLWSRNGLKWTNAFPEVASALPKDIDYLIDGEVVAIGAHGTPDFQTLQNVFRSPGKSKIQYYVFDIIWLEGHDLRMLPLVQRKELLRHAIFPSSRKFGPVCFAPYQKRFPASLFARLCEEGGEGIICKDGESAYVSGRSGTWLKVKCTGNEEFVIGGYTLQKTSNLAIGALLLGTYRRGCLEYRGKVGTGFSDEERLELYRTLSKLRSKRSAFCSSAEIKVEGSIWVKPSLLAQISFSEITKSGALRHPSYQGLRKDKNVSAGKR